MFVKELINRIKYVIRYPWNMFKKKAPLISYITGRLVTMLFLLFFLGFALFGLMELAPGDIVDQMMTQQLMSSMDGGKNADSNINNSFGEKSFSEEQMNQLRKEFGLDKPFYIQYFKWLNRVIVHHDLGTSLISRAPVSFLLTSRIWNSVLLNLISLVFITLFSFILGVYFSSKAGTKLDVGVTFFALFFHFSRCLLCFDLAFASTQD